ncbi:unnamed protein product [Lupinus luteus]|uniref:Non-specific serine/threonine protein kinase n=1 Tax=Lupinus luteus TaxID=3873 RepID=A0AAV1WTG8_LUPLU
MKQLHTNNSSMNVFPMQLKTLLYIFLLAVLNLANNSISGKIPDLNLPRLQIAR